MNIFGKGVTQKSSIRIWVEGERPEQYLSFPSNLIDY